VQVEGVAALVTGGLSGLGAATARMIVEAGGRVAVLDRNTADPTILESLGDRAVYLPTDVTRPEQVTDAVAETVSRFGRLDVCVNCAGRPDAARMLNREGQPFPLDVYRRVVDVNLVGLFDVLRHSAAAMASNDPNGDGERGVIVNVASIAGYEGQAGQAAYAASKGGVIAMTLPLARDLGSVGIRVMTVCPGIFETGMLAGTSDKVRERMLQVHVFPKRLGQPSDFAALVRAIIENPMLNGEVIRLDAGARLPHG
jgi:3-hydroxyacyl-CoA dehydrogenase / 3-hydroxy-2-methylbutyryl-CoA dehydrogenase